MEALSLLGVAINPENAAGSARQRQISRHLYEYLNRDYSDARNQRMEQFPKRGGRHQLRTVPWIHRVATDLATLYRDPLRTLSEGDIGSYQGVLDEGEIDLDLDEMNRHAVVLQQAFALVMPTASRRVYLLVVPMHDIEFELDDLRPHIDSVSLVRVRITESAPGANPSICEITRTTAKFVSGPREGEGLFNAEGTNPLGVIPLLAVHARRPAPGTFVVHVAEDLLHSQRAQDRAATTLLQVADAQGFAQPVHKRSPLRGEKEEIQVGPETAIDLLEDEDFKFASPDPNLEGYQAMSSAYTEVSTAMNGLSPASFLRTAATTGVARMVEMWDRSQERVILVKQFRRLEQRLYDLIAAWMRIFYGASDWPAARVSIEYRQAQPPSDPLHELQALEGEIRLGLVSAVEVLMARHKIDREEAETRLAQHRLDNATLAPPPPPPVVP